MLTPGAEAAYLGPFRLADTVTPILLGLTLMLMLMLTLMLPLRGRSWAAFVPAAVYLLADLAEDWAVAQILLAGPEVTAAAVARGSVLTLGKFSALALAVVVAILALAARLWRRGPV